MRDVFRAYNFHEIRTPIFEATALFARAVGEETDVVSKEMYTWWDGVSPSLVLERAWREQYDDKYSAIQSNVRIGNRQIDFVARVGIDETLIEAKLRPDTSTIERLNELQKAWGAMHEFRAVKLAIALPDSELERARSLPLGEIALQPVEMPAMYEPPRSLTLRPENTAGVVRAYIEHGLEKRGLNKLYYIGPQFRRERPQKGRYRQFYQIGAEVIGPPPPAATNPLRDAEVLEMLATLLNRLGVRDWKLKINSVGSSREREIFTEVLRKALEPVVLAALFRLSTASGDKSVESPGLQSAGGPANH